MRAASTYRGARRNYALRELKTTWGPRFYYSAHIEATQRMDKEREARRAKQQQEWDRLTESARKAIVATKKAFAPVANFLRRGGARGR